MNKKDESRVQWQDGVGNIRIRVGEEAQADSNGPFRVVEVDWMWTLVIMGTVVFMVSALCILSRVNLRVFSRKAKRRLRKSSKKNKSTSIAPKSQGARDTIVDVVDDGVLAQGTQGVKAVKSYQSPQDVNQNPKPNARGDKTQNPKHVVLGDKTRNILSLIDDTLLEEGALTGTTLTTRAVSSDSIDEILGFTMPRRSSAVSLDLSLVMADNARPMFRRK